MTRRSHLLRRRNMLCVDESGEGVQVEPTPHRAAFVIDREVMRLMRAETFTRYRDMDFSTEMIARTFNKSESTVKADIAWLKGERASRLEAEARDDEASLN